MFLSHGANVRPVCQEVPPCRTRVQSTRISHTECMFGTYFHDRKFLFCVRCFMSIACNTLGSIALFLHEASNMHDHLNLLKCLVYGGRFPFVSASFFCLLFRNSVPTPMPSCATFGIFANCYCEEKWM